MKSVFSILNEFPIDYWKSVEDYCDTLKLDNVIIGLDNGINMEYETTNTTDNNVVFDLRPVSARKYNKKNEKNFRPLYCPEIKDVKFCNPATIVWFEDGSKTVAVAGHGDTYDKEVGLGVCILKRILGNKKYREVMNKWCYTETREVLN